MRPNSRLDAINWQDLVRETVRRRKNEGMTQKQHAELAGVSVPVMVAFDKGETSMSVGRALAIMDVVGLSSDRGGDRLARWLTKSEAWFEDMLDKRHVASDWPGRFPNGHWQAAYLLKDQTEDLSPKDLLETFLPGAAAKARMSGWPPFWVPTRQGIRPWIDDDGIVTCWLGDPDDEGKVFTDAGHADFWRVSPQGEAFLLRGYEEDSFDQVDPATMLDLELPVIRTAEVLAHARAFGALVYGSRDGAIDIMMTWTGLTGRSLLAWGNARRIGPDSGEYVARADTASARTSFRVSEYQENRAQIVCDLTQALYSRFSYFDMSVEVTAAILADFERRR